MAKENDKKRNKIKSNGWKEKKGRKRIKVLKSEIKKKRKMIQKNDKILIYS